MLSTRFVSIVIKVFVVVIGATLGWIYANSFDIPLRSSDAFENVQSMDNNTIFPTVIPDDVEIASKLAERVRLLCLVPTKRDMHKEHSTYLKNTWGSHCNKLLFVTDEFDRYIDASIAIAYNATGENDKPWHKVKYALQYIHDNYIDDFDWILKAELNNYVIVENVRYLLHNISQYEPNVVARHAGPTKIDDDSAYVLSREALRKLVADAFAPGTSCSTELSVENEFTKINECLNDAEVNFVKSQDGNGRELFLKDNVIGTINSLQSPNDFRTKISNFTAVWPKASAHDMHIFNFFIYEMRSYGASQDMPPLYD